MPVTVYIWEFRGKEAVGHASMSLSDGTHISWWPQCNEGDKYNKKTGIVKSSKAQVDQTLEDDIAGENGERPKIILVKDLDENAIRSWWTDFKGKETMWRLLDQNCFTVVYKALCAGGALNRLPEDIADVYKKLWIWYPGAVDALVKDLNYMATKHQTMIDAV